MGAFTLTVAGAAPGTPLVVITSNLFDPRTTVQRTDVQVSVEPSGQTRATAISAITGREEEILAFPDGFGGLGRRQVQTELVHMSLEGGAIQATAGQPALDRLNELGKAELFRPSLGEVESQNLDGSGGAAADFPADSFFDVFVVVDSPLGTLFNKEPFVWPVEASIASRRQHSTRTSRRPASPSRCIPSIMPTALVAYLNQAGMEQIQRSHAVPT